MGESKEQKMFRLYCVINESLDQLNEADRRFMYQRIGRKAEADEKERYRAPKAGRSF
jgi:hypothetical protein